MIKELEKKKMDAQSKKLDVYKRVNKYKELPTRDEEWNN